ncbi:MAG TPA: hypothetical protein VKM55_25030 [Candidatus Lokiarchaeia archaeon]|nr:hypothetical protein [Candidatus Lokiarchaeia archaeon]
MGKEQIGQTDFLLEDMISLAIFLSEKRYFSFLIPLGQGSSILIDFIFKYLTGIDAKALLSHQ